MSNQKEYIMLWYLEVMEVEFAKSNCFGGDRVNKLMEVDSVSFGYDENDNILNEISFELLKGDRIGLIGPNGVGKTTLFKLLCGIEKPSSGNIKICGNTLKQGVFTPEIGFIFQSADDQLFCPTVFDDISFGPKNMRLNDKQVESNVFSALRTLDIEYLKEKQPHHLSGGEKRLVAIAGILAMKSQIGIYDEPTSNLDMRYRAKLIDFLNGSCHDGIIVSSHDLDFLVEVCNKIILIDDGKIIKTGNVKDIFCNEKLMKNHGLFVPYSLRNITYDKVI